MTQERYFTILIFPLFILSSKISHAGGKDTWQLEYLQQRYQDYFIHENMKKRQEEKRLRGAKKQRQYRRELEEKGEMARQEFIKKRNQQKKSINWEKLEKEYLKQEEQRETKRNVLRKKYAQKQKRLRRIKKEVKKIPEEKEVGLE